MAGEGWADDEGVMETEMTSLPGKRNCCDRMAGEGWADDEGVMETERWLAYLGRGTAVIEWLVRAELMMRASWRQRDD